MVTALAVHRRSARAQGLVEWVGALFLGVVLLMLGVHAVGVLLDYLAAIRNPYVWTTARASSGTRQPSFPAPAPMPPGKICRSSSSTTPRSTIC